MNQQIRKFEQEAIVREVLNKLRTTAETKQKDLMKEPNYKVIAETIKSKNNIQIKPIRLIRRKWFWWFRIAMSIVSETSIVLSLQVSAKN